MPQRREPDPTTPCVLAVDLGTSGPKAAVIDLNGQVLGAGRSFVQTFQVEGGGVEQNPTDIWRATCEAMQSAVAAAKGKGVKARAIRAVLCTSQYSSIVAVDAQGTAVHNLILWQDQRGATAALRRSAVSPRFPRWADNPATQLLFLQRHGLPPVAGGISLTHMRYLKYARPDVYDRTVNFLEPMDFLALRLTGRATANQCTAFMSLTVDNRTLVATGYDPALVKASLIDGDKFPQLVPLDAVLGPVLPDVAETIGLDPSTVVITGMNDTHAGMMGSASFAGSHAGLSIGSTAVLVTHVDRKRTDIRHALLSKPSPVPETYVLMGENGVAGTALEQFLRHVVYARDDFGELNPDNQYDVLQRVVDGSPPGAAGLMFLPWLKGSLAPRADARIRGGFLNMNTTTTRTDMARAVLEGVALNLAWMLGPAQRFAKRDFSHLVFYGGGAESPAWGQIMAAVLRLPVHAVEQPSYTTCWGAAMLGFERLGLLSFDDIAMRLRIRQVFEPDQATSALYAERLEQFEAAFKANRPIFHALNPLADS